MTKTTAEILGMILLIFIVVLVMLSPPSSFAAAGSDVIIPVQTREHPDWTKARELWFNSPQSRHATKEQEEAALDLLVHVYIPRHRPGNYKNSTTRSECLKAFTAWVTRRGWVAGTQDQYEQLQNQTCGWPVEIR